MNQWLIPENVTGILGSYGPVEKVRANRIRVMAEPGSVRDAITAVKERLACDRLVAISTADIGSDFELIYHFTGPHRIIISVTTRVPRGSPEIRTLSDILPAAGIYERQIHDLFGIMFTGHPGLKRIMLNEDWPEGEYPLRKDWKPVPGKFYGGIKKESE